MKLICLLDCNNFFVSCERLFRPDLRSKPVVVLSGNDGCVVARSNEVKELGIPMGVPVFQVKKEFQTHGVTTFSSNFTLYRDISGRIMSTLREMVGTIEVYSIDEAFFTLEVASVQEAEERLLSIKQTIEQHIGVPVSLGAAKSKTIAKYASEKEKRGSGVCVLIDKAWVAETEHIDIGAIWGVGGKLAGRYRTQSIATVASLRAASRERISSLFGVVGCRLYDELHEQPVWQVGSRAGIEQKSIMSTRSFGETTHSKTVVLEALAYHVTHVAAELRQMGMVCSRVYVLAQPSRHGDWKLQGGGQEVILDTPTSDTRVLLKIVEAALTSFFNTEVPYKKAGVVVSGLMTPSFQGTLFIDESAVEAADTAVMEVLDSITARFGAESLHIGSGVHQAVWQPRQQHISPKYTTKWSEIRTITT